MESTNILCDVTMVIEKTELLHYLLYYLLTKAVRKYVTTVNTRFYMQDMHTRYQCVVSRMPTSTRDMKFLLLYIWIWLINMLDKLITKIIIYGPRIILYVECLHNVHTLYPLKKCRILIKKCC